MSIEVFSPESELGSPERRSSATLRLVSDSLIANATRALLLSSVVALGSVAFLPVAIAQSYDPFDAGSITPDAAPQGLSDGTSPTATALSPSTKPAPVADSRPAPPTQHGGVIKTILGILVLLTLAYLGGHAKVRAWEERLGISQMMAAGFPFVVLGMIAHLPAIGILTDDVLLELDPLLHVGLGCIGFVFGFRFDLRTLRQLPVGSERLVFFSTFFPFVLALGLSAFVLSLVSPQQDMFVFSGPLFLRDALILGTAAAMSA